MHTRKSGW